MKAIGEDHGWLSWEAAIGLFTIALAISTCGLWWETRRLGKLGRDQRDDLRRSVKATELAAQAAWKNAEIAEKALIGVQRPVLRLDIAQWGPPLPTKRRSGEKAYEPIIDFDLTNYGKIAAILRACTYEIITREPNEKSEFFVPSARTHVFGNMADDALEGRHILPEQETLRLKFQGYIGIETDELLFAMWGTSRRRLFLIGVLDYEDVIGIHRRKGFTYFFSPFPDGHGKWEPLDASNCDFDEIVAYEGEGEGEGESDRSSST